MANPYKKAEQVQKKAPGSRPVVQQPVEPKIEEKQVVSTPVVEEKAMEPVKENVIIETNVKDLFADVVEKKRNGKTRGFYVEDDVFDALEKFAKKKKLSNSKVLNTLLRSMLIDNK